MLICEGYLDVISLHQAGFTNEWLSWDCLYQSACGGF